MTGFASEAFDSSAFDSEDEVSSLYAHAQAQVLIKQTYNVHAQAQCWVENTYYGFAQAEAWIEGMYFGHAQALASILGPYQQHAQAQASILQVYYGFAQAQGYISTASAVHAQAQAQIKAKYYAHAQAQTWVKRTARGHAQARPRIKATSNRFAQARVRIVKLAGYANARTWIRAEGVNRFAQAQTTLATRFWQPAQATAMVRGIGKPKAQAQAYINDRMPHAQAQAQIKNGDRVHAQAQAKLIRPRRIVAQAQAKIKAFGIQGYAQAQVLLNQRFRFAQAQAKIATNYTQHAQAQCLIIKAGGYAQAQCLMYGTITHQHAQAQTRIKNTYRGYAQAKAAIERAVRGYGQSQTYIKVKNAGYGQAQCYVLKPVRTGQAQARITTHPQRVAQAQAIITRTEGHAQAAAMVAGDLGLISNDQSTYLVNFNGYYLPGYAQQETFESSMRIKAHDSAYIDGSLSEYEGLSNKIIDIRFKLVGTDFVDLKRGIRRAGTIMRSKKEGPSRLFIDSTDAYYIGTAQTINAEADAFENRRHIEYTAKFAVRPWLISINTITLSGAGSIDTGSRTLADGGWTPAVVQVTGTNVTVSGYTDTEIFTGYFAVSGAVTDLVIDTEAYTATIAGVNKNALMRNLDYAMYVGPAKTYFAVSGASSITIRYQNRWY